MQLNVAEFEQLVRARCRDIAQELEQVKSELRAFKDVFTDLERSYTERGKALKEATEKALIGEWIGVKNLHFQIGYPNGGTMSGLKFSVASGADRVRFYYGESGALPSGPGDTSDAYRTLQDTQNDKLRAALDTSSGQPEGR